MLKERAQAGGAFYELTDSSIIENKLMGPPLWILNGGLRNTHFFTLGKPGWWGKGCI